MTEEENHCCIFFSLILFLIFIIIIILMIEKSSLYSSCEQVSSHEKENYLKCQKGMEFFKEHDIKGKILIRNSNKSLYSKFKKFLKSF